MDKLFIVIHKIHLYASFVIATFLLMYFLSGAVIIMGNIFPRENVITISEKVALKDKLSEEETVTNISTQYEIHGVKNKITKTNGGNNYAFTRPGYRAEINFIEGQDSIQVIIRKGTFWSGMIYFHRLRGITGGWSHKVWIVLYDLSCIALLVFAFTGIYLWWKLERKKLLGIVFLFLSTGLTVFTIWYLMVVC